MVGRFSLPSLPSIPTSLVDLLDTSPQVFYPPSRPTSRASTSTVPTSSSAVSSCPSSPRRRPVAFPDCDRGVAPLQPPPFWSGAAHPHTDAPLGSRDKPLPRRQSSLSMSGHSHWQQEATPQWAPIRPSRPTHRRSQSAAPSSFNYPSQASYAPSTAPPLQPVRTETRGLHPSASAASLPTLAEDDASSSGLMLPPPPPLPIQLEDRDPPQRSSRHNRRWSWIEPKPAEERRRRAQSTVVMTNVPGVGTFVEPPLPDRLRRRNSQIVGLPSQPVFPVLSKPPTPVCPSTPSRSRRGSISSITFPDGARASPTPAQTSISVSDVEALATWSEEPVSPTLQRSQSTKSRRDSISSPSEALRARLRTLSKLEGRECPSTPPKLARRNTFTSPRSTNVTPGHGTPATPGSSTPTTSSHAHMAPPSPTPTRRRPMHRHTLSLPFAEDTSSRPTTSRLRQPAQLSMAPTLDDLPHSQPGHSGRPRSRPVSMLGPPSPMLASSPGSLISDNGSASPTASIESLTLSPAWLNLNLTLSSQQKRSSYHDKRSSISVSEKRSSITSINEHQYQRELGHQQPQHQRDKRASVSSIHSLAPSRRGSHQSAYDWRRGAPSHVIPSRPSVSVSDESEGERFLDFDDI